MMGSPMGEGLDDERPQHRVCVDTFWIGKYEVTQEEYVAIAGTYPAKFKGTKKPVERISWKEADAFTKKFSEKHKVKARLPYEAEWEYAARGVNNSKYYWGNDMDSGYAWYDKNSGNQTHPVGEKKPNVYGLYDMSGNVFEWCNDWYSDNFYKYKGNNSDNPRGPKSGRYRVLRGGGWGNNEFNMRSAYRSWSEPAVKQNNYGFRILLER